jgi:glycosyltransferase involved in cell wall biosynthesis
VTELAAVVQPKNSMSKSRKRVLLSAYACSPRWGSEPGVGWQWLIRLARDYDVVLVTHAYFREHLEPAFAAETCKVQVVYVGLPSLGLHPHVQLNSRTYCIWWQLKLRTVVKQLIKDNDFDLIHHLTWGTLRFPCFLGGLGPPLVMGPLGGGEAAPLRLFNGLPLKAKLFDYVRSLTLFFVKIDPMARWGPVRSALVFCKSVESLKCLPTSVQQRAVVVPEIGSPPVDLSIRQRLMVDSPSQENRRFRLLFAGRLLGWKGVALALGATARLISSGMNISLDIAGAGPLKEYLANQIAAHSLEDRVRLLGQVPRDELLELYARADLFVFPSLHDSSGNVVLEALSRGLPVVCLDLGGPQLYVNSSCGIVVSTAGRSRPQVEEALAAAISEVLTDRPRLTALSQQAAIHAQRQSWDLAIAHAYSLIHQRLKWS